MTYNKIVKGAFIERPNRFIARVTVDGEEHTVHVKNTGRCRELLVKGRTVYLAESENPARKTRFDLVAVEKIRDDGGVMLVNMDSQSPNTAAFEWVASSGLFSADAKIRRELKYGDSRFDLYIEDGSRRAFMEVKGVTLERDGASMFPDAPTERGAKHLRGLADAVAEGYEAYVLFVIQMKGVCCFAPNEATDPAFCVALRNAADAGVVLLARDCIVTPDTMIIDKEVPVII